MLNFDLANRISGYLKQTNLCDLSTCTCRWIVLKLKRLAVTDRFPLNLIEVSSFIFRLNKDWLIMLLQHNTWKHMFLFVSVVNRDKAARRTRWMVTDACSSGELRYISSEKRHTVVLMWVLFWRRRSFASSQRGSRSVGSVKAQKCLGEVLEYIHWSILLFIIYCVKKSLRASHTDAEGYHVGLYEMSGGVESQWRQASPTGEVLGVWKCCKLDYANHPMNAVLPHNSKACSWLQCTVANIVKSQKISPWTQNQAVWGKTSPLLRSNLERKQGFESRRVEQAKSGLENKVWKASEEANKETGWYIHSILQGF